MNNWKELVTGFLGAAALLILFLEIVFAAELLRY